MAEPVIRRATAADSAALLALENRTFPSDRIPPRQMRYLLTRAKAVTWVAIEADQLIGYVMLFVPRLPRPCRVYSLAVDSRSRGRGIATSLLEAVLDFAREHGYRRVHLEVRASDTPVQSLYGRFGFTPIARLAGYYEDGEAALRMALTLLS